jgi:hypothetical protein
MITLQQFIAACERAELDDLLSEGTPALQSLIEALIAVTQPFETGDQALAFAILTGMIIGEMDGHLVEHDRLHLITADERLDVHRAIAKRMAVLTIQYRNEHGEKPRVM